MKITIQFVWGIMMIIGASLSLFGACANELNMGGKKITNVASPQNPNDAATRAYVDRGGAALNGSTVTHNGLTYNVIYAGGKAWLDRNLGATRVATHKADSEGYGDLYQWGRLRDGHEKCPRPNIVDDNSSCASGGSGTTATLSTDVDPQHSHFIINSNVISGNWMTSNRTELWTAPGSNSNGVCPTGWRIPTLQEFLDVGMLNDDDAFNKLKLSVGGTRQFRDGTLISVGREGRYWTMNGANESGHARYLYIGPTHVGSASQPKANGMLVRCVKSL